jgi:glycosyltransferase involved in cell wall biosynthesis
MKLTIAIPTYNKANLLSKTLEQIVNQINETVDLSDLEILVIDNNSTENIKKVVEYYKARLPLRYIKNEINIGSSQNFYKCILEAKGDYVWLLSNKNYLYPYSINKIFKAIEDKPAIIFTEFSQGENKNPNIKICHKSVGFEKDTLIEQPENFNIFLPDFNKITNLVAISFAIIKKELWDKDLMWSKIDTCFPHSYSFLQVASMGGVSIISSPLWIWRANLERVKESTLHDDEPASMWNYIEYGKNIGFNYSNDYLKYKKPNIKITAKGNLYNWLKKNNLLWLAKIFYRLPRLVKYYFGL